MSTTLWLTVAEATTYFSTRLGSSDWTAASDADKTAALTTGQWQIESCGVYDFESGITPTDAMQEAVCEQALFLLSDQEGQSKRESLQAQGVRSFTVSDFSESLAGIRGIVIAPRAHIRLSEYNLGGSNTFKFER
ncbi:hypothetical protein HQ520_16355 [bacterium]|nr:hypothetical protein [bacterium]